MKRHYIQKSIFHYGQGKCVSAPTATNYYHGYNTNNTFPGAANLVQNIDATEAMRQAEGEEGGSDSYSLLAYFYFHYQFGGKKPITLSTSELDLSYVSKGDLEYMPDKNIYIVNLFRLNPTSPTALALGKIWLSHIKGDIYKIQSDKFDFDYQAKGSFYRNAATFIGGAVFGQFYNTPVTTWSVIRNTSKIGGPFKIYFDGTVYIKP